MEKQEKQSKYRLDFSTLLQLGLAAGFIDLIGLIPVVEDLLIIPYWIYVTLTLRKHGVSVFNARKLVTMAVSIVVGMVPALQALPEALLGIAAVAIIVYAEDISGIKIVKGGGKTIDKNALAGALNQANVQRALYLKKDGLRLPPERRTKNQPSNTGGRRDPRQQFIPENEDIPIDDASAALE